MHTRQWPVDKRLRFWHPVALASSVARSPRSVQCCGVPVLLFTNRDSGVVALYDRCAHRRMPLSHGSVGHDGVTCAYHGCVFSSDGTGYCPTTRSHRFQVPVFETTVRNDVVWIRAPEALVGPVTDTRPAYPAFDATGDDDALLSVIHKQIAAPLQLVVDNMTELEHTGAVHKHLAFGTDDFDTVETRCEGDAEGVSVFYRGRQRPLPRYLSILSGLKRSDVYVQTARVTFTPPCALYRIGWTPHVGDEPRDFGLRFVIYYTEVDATHTSLFAFVYWKTRGTLLGRMPRLAGRILCRLVSAELDRDKQIIEKVPRQEATLDWFQLNRFDRPLVMTRRLMKRHYASGLAPLPTVASGASGARRGRSTQPPLPVAGVPAARGAETYQ